MSAKQRPQGRLAKPKPSTTAMRVLGLALAVAGLWVARAFLLQIVFAAILATAMWPLYRRLIRSATRPERLVLVPLALTLFTGVILILPLVILAAEAVRDADVMGHWLVHASRTGVPAPHWLAGFPIGGRWLLLWWNQNLADPRGAAALFQQIDAAAVAGWLSSLAATLLSWAMFLFVTLLALFIFLRDGVRAATATCGIARRLYGSFGERFVTQLAETVRGTVNGTLFIAFSEGTLIGIGYAVTRVPHALAFTVITTAFALVPFGAWAAFGVASLVLVAEGHAAAGALLFGYGSAVMLTGDNLIQPALIGNAIRLPFLWTFVGIFGGMYSFGLVGLFIGPAIMAALFLLWTEWQGSDSD